MAKKIAVIYPYDSSPTLVTYIFAQRVLKLIRNKLPNAQIDKFPVLSANRLAWIFSKAFNSGYDLVVYAGHGLKNMVLGQAYLAPFLPIPLGLLAPMNTDRDNPRVKIFYAIACLTGQKLGPALTKKRVWSYVGNEDYTFIAYPRNERNYMDDFIDTWMEFVRGLLDGLRVRDAFKRFKDKMWSYVDLYNRLARTGRYVYARYYAYLMKRNAEGFRLFGRGDITL